MKHPGETRRVEYLHSGPYLEKCAVLLVYSCKYYQLQTQLIVKKRHVSGISCLQESWNIVLLSLTVCHRVADEQTVVLIHS